MLEFFKNVDSKGHPPLGKICSKSEIISDISS
jgi:hypothetical protein